MEKVNDVISILKVETNRAIKESYEKGYIDGVVKCHALDGIKTPLNNEEYKTIKDFAVWCYVNGIDFSYMGSSARTFVEKTLERYEKDRTKGE